MQYVNEKSFADGQRLHDSMSHMQVILLVLTFHSHFPLE